MTKPYKRGTGKKLGPRFTLEERFWSKVDKNAEGGHWLWTGSKNNMGYPTFAKDTTCQPVKMVLAYRMAWELLRGPVPDRKATGLVLDHICKVPLCVNPEHLRIVTQQFNSTANSVSPMARNKAKTHCPQGHEYTPENTAIIKREGGTTKNGKRVGKTTGRMCLTCHPTYWRHALVPRPRPPGSHYRKTDPDFPNP